jgi:hypothetical protein
MNSLLLAAVERRRGDALERKRAYPAMRSVGIISPDAGRFGEDAISY